MSNINKILKKIIFVILIIVIFGVAICFLYFYLWFKVGITNLNNRHNKNIEIELQNRDINTKVFYDYIRNTYGVFSNSFQVDAKPDVVSTGTDFDIQVPFMEETFRIIIDTNNNTIHSDNFYKVLAKDSKFNHLYSDWVKKKIGCEDRNIELKFANFNINKKMNIKFNNIKTISNDYDELFENLTNYYLIEIYVKNIKELSEINYKQYADTINNKYFPLIVNLVGKSEVEHYVELFNNDINLLEINYHLLGKTDYSKVDIHYEVEYK